MSGLSRNAALAEAVAEWKRKYEIGENDPMLASLELWQIFLSHSQPSETAAEYQELKKPLEQLNGLANKLEKHCGEVIREFRAVPRIRSELWAFPYFTVILASVAALIIGIFIGKFLVP
jgi:hypothetical protein